MMARTVTVRFNDDESVYKGMLNDLKHADLPGNPYYKRSESEIVKLLLRDILVQEFAKYCRATVTT